MRQFDFVVDDDIIQYTPENEFMTLDEVCEITGRAKKTIKNWHWAKDLPAKIENKKWFFLASDLEMFLMCFKQPRRKKRRMFR